MSDRSMTSFLQPVRFNLDQFRRQPLSFLLPLLPLLGVIVLFLLFSNEQNRDFDINFSYPVLWLTLAIGLVGGVLSLPSLATTLATVWHRHKAWVLVIPLLAAIAATAFVAEHVEPRHRVQSDEAGLLSNARSMEYNGKAASCDQGYFSETELDCIALVQNFKAKAVPFFFSLIQQPEFPHGMTDAIVFATTLSLLIPTAMLMFLALLVYTRSNWLATLTTVLFLAHPTVLFQFHSASVEPWYVFFAAFAAFALVSLNEQLAAAAGASRTARFQPLALLGLIAALVAFAAQTRQESLVSLSFILAPLLLHRALTLRDKLFFFGSLAVFILPVLWLIFAHRGYNMQAGANQTHGLGNLLEHLPIAWQVMTTPTENGELVMPFLANHMWLAALGFVYTLVQVVRKDELSIRVLWFFLLALPQTLVILQTVSGDMTIEINQRYSVVFIPLIAVMAAQGTRILLHLPALITNPKLRRLFEPGALLLISVVLLAQTASYHQSFADNIMYSRNFLAEEDEALRNWIELNDEHAPRLWIYSRPWHLVGYGRSSIHYNSWQRMKPELRQQLAERFNQQVYYVRGMDCWDSRNWHPKAVEDRITGDCERFERSNALHLAHRERMKNSYDLEVFQLDFSSNPIAGRLRIMDLAAEALDDQIRLTGQVNDCGGRSGLVWAWGNTRHEWQCKAGQLEATFASTPGLYLLQMLNDGDQSTWSRVVLHPGAGVTPLTDLDPVFAEVGWAQLQTNRSNGGNPLTVGHSQYPSGLGAHARSIVSYVLPQGYSRLQTGYGLDDEEVGGDGAIFKVFGDGRLLWESNKVVHGQVHYADLDIASVSKIDLVTEPGEDNRYDHTNWIMPTLLATPGDQGSGL
jgi:hypothetical protein